MKQTQPQKRERERKTERNALFSYLCGFSYYLSLCQDNTKTLFVHIPIVDDEVISSLFPTPKNSDSTLPRLVPVENYGKNCR